MNCFLRMKLNSPSFERPLILALTLDFQVNSAFNGKRKMLRKSLQHLCSSSEIEAALHKIGLPVTVNSCSLPLYPPPPSVICSLLKMLAG